MSLEKIHKKIVGCDECPRLRRHCLGIAETKRKAYLDQTYWGRPITGFGDPNGRLIIVGLAPAAHGANRTGRIFTGDQSGFWLYRALHKHGFANQHSWERKDDGLELRDAYVTCVVKCAPPDNKPTPAETARCAPHLRAELAALRSKRVYLALGKIALDALWPHVGGSSRRPKFAHGAVAELADGMKVLMSYHPSQQNTFTKRLTEPMLDEVFEKAKRLLEAESDGSNFRI